jgi:hypothetical protein
VLLIGAAVVIRRHIGPAFAPLLRRAMRADAVLAVWLAAIIVSLGLLVGAACVEPGLGGSLLVTARFSALAALVLGVVHTRRARSRVRQARLRGRRPAGRR